jgi:hypothetical protein
MTVYAQDLNQTSTSGAVSSVARSVSTLNLNGLSLANLQLGSIIGYVNIFLLAWTFFYCFFSLIPFFNERINFAGGELGMERSGMKGLYAAQKIAFSYVATLPFLAIFAFMYENFKVISPLGALVYLPIVIWKISSDVNKFAPFLGILDWSAGISKLLQKMAIWGKD